MNCEVSKGDITAKYQHQMSALWNLHVFIISFWIFWLFLMKAHEMHPLPESDIKNKRGGA